MHCRVTSVRLQPGKFEEALALYENSVLPAAKLQKGFKDVHLMADRAVGKVLAISIWETEADMVEGERNGYYREQITKFSTMFAETPVAEHYEVIS